MKSNANEKKRSKICFQLRDQLKAEMSEDTMKAILDFNKQAIPVDYSDVSQSMFFQTQINVTHRTSSANTTQADKIDQFIFLNVAIFTGQLSKCNTKKKK